MEKEMTAYLSEASSSALNIDRLFLFKATKNSCVLRDTFCCTKPKQDNIGKEKS